MFSDKYGGGGDVKRTVVNNPVGWCSLLENMS